MKHLLTTAAVAAMLAASPALAANDAMKKQDQAQAQAQDSTQQDTPAARSGQTAASGSIDFVESQSASDWLASDLAGQSVQNAQGDALGGINNVVVNEEGSVVAVVIGVGGFLGIGEKDVAVPYDALEFKKQAAAAEPSDRMTQQDPARSAPSGSPMAQQAPAGGQSAGESTRQAMTSENPQDNMVIVLNTSRDQLEAAPAYKYVGEENEATSGSEPTSGQTKSQ